MISPIIFASRSDKDGDRDGLHKKKDVFFLCGQQYPQAPPVPYIIVDCVGHIYI